MQTTSAKFVDVSINSFTGKNEMSLGIEEPTLLAG